MVRALLEVKILTDGFAAALCRNPDIIMLKTEEIYVLNLNNFAGFNFFSQIQY